MPQLNLPQTPDIMGPYNRALEQTGASLSDLVKMFADYKLKKKLQEEKAEFERGQAQEKLGWEIAKEERQNQVARQTKKETETAELEKLLAGQYQKQEEGALSRQRELEEVGRLASGQQPQTLEGYKVFQGEKRQVEQDKPKMITTAQVEESVNKIIDNAKMIATTRGEPITDRWGNASYPPPLFDQAKFAEAIDKLTMNAPEEIRMRVKEYLPKLPIPSVSRQEISDVFRTPPEQRPSPAPSTMPQGDGAPPAKPFQALQNVVGPRPAPGPVPPPTAMQPTSAQQAGRQFETLPDPRQFQGKIARDTVTGKRYRSDGVQWVPVP